MNNKGQVSTVSHTLLWIVIIVIAGYLVYIATHSQTKSNTFATGSKQTNTYHVTRNYALVALDLALTPFNIHGCTREDAPGQVMNEANNDTQTNEDTINATVLNSATD